MGSSAPKAQTVTNRTELPAYLEGATRENLARADAISNQPYQAYQGQMSAGFAPEQLAAFDYAQRGVGGTTPFYNQALNQAAADTTFQPAMMTPGSVTADRVSAQNFLSGNVGAYMNPYIQNVEDAALSRLQGATQQAVNRIGDQAFQARAFGGSRQGIAEGVALGEAARSAGELSANLRSQGFNQASALMQQDAQRALQADLANQQTGLQAGQFTAQQGLQAQQLNQAAGIQALQARLAAGQQLGALAQQAQQSRQMDAGLLENIGQQRQALNQTALDEAYARFIEQRNYPTEMLNLRLGATSATPYSTTTTGQQFVPRGNNFLSGLGTVGTAASGIASIAALF